MKLHEPKGWTRRSAASLAHWQDIAVRANTQGHWSFDTGAARAAKQDSKEPRTKILSNPGLASRLAVLDAI